jgi:hypothetical protein
VNFKTPEGLEILRRLIKKSDVLVENFISGKLASMGLGYEDCKKLNPKLIYASITGMFPLDRLSQRVFISLSVAVYIQNSIRVRPDRALQVSCRL